MTEPQDDKGRIIVDDDWKAQAQREKEEADRLAREEQEEEGGLPTPSLAEIVQLIIIQASIGLGGMQDPQTGQRIPAQLPLAKHYIDLLEVLQQKTAGNVTEQEKRLIDGALQELRMVFVQIAGLGTSPSPGASPAGQA
ncbi:MAG: DUF1844 domain-containing protein [Phycisphaerae bacterium]|nr:DUF1844 domain-containing protein [Phycisphaerae bacterium]